MEDRDHLHPCSDPDCAQIAPLIATATLGGELSDQEQALVLSALATCAGCRQRLAGYARVAQALPLSVAEAQPSPGLRARILSTSAQAGPPADLRARILRASAETGQRPPGRRAPRRGGLAGALVGAALALTLLIGQQRAIQQQTAQISQQQAAIVQQQQQTARNRGVVIAAFGNDDAREAPLIARASGAASGRVLLSPGAGAVAVYAKQLPTLAAGQGYQVWLQGADGPLALGRFQPDPNARAWVLLQLDAPLPEPKAIFITVEPEAGSGAPGGPELLRATFP